MSSNFTDSTQTWPKSRITKDIANDAKARIKLASALDRAKAFVEETEGQEDDERTKEVRDLVQHLYEALERNNSHHENQQDKSRRASAMPPNLQVIREEPNIFGSMVWCDMDRFSRPTSRLNSIIALNNLNPYDSNRRFSDAQRRFSSVASRNGSIVEVEEANQVVDMSQVYANLDPIYIRAIPHLLIFTTSVLYIMLGAMFFRYIDEDLAKKTYKDIIIFSYEICATIGWGSISPVRSWTRIALIVYATFGVPLIMASLANLGRLMTEFYCIDWIYITSVLRGKPAAMRDFSSELPIKAALNLLVAHQLIGLLLFNGLIQDLGVVGSIYFSITSIATIGFGDIIPKPANTWELIIVLAYVSTGTVILSALFISISYYIQLLYYGYISQWLHSLYKPKRKKSAKITPQKC